MKNIVLEYMIYYIFNSV